MQKDCYLDWVLRVSGSRRGEYGLGNDDLSSLTVDVEGHLARFVAKTWEERNSLVLTVHARPFQLYFCHIYTALLW